MRPFSVIRGAFLLARGGWISPCHQGCSGLRVSCVLVCVRNQENEIRALSVSLAWACIPRLLSLLSAPEACPRVSWRHAVLRLPHVAPERILPVSFLLSTVVSGLIHLGAHSLQGMCCGLLLAVQWQPVPSEPLGALLRFAALGVGRRLVSVRFSFCEQSCCFHSCGVGSPLWGSTCDRACLCSCPGPCPPLPQKPCAGPVRGSAFTLGSQCPLRGCSVGVLSCPASVLLSCVCRPEGLWLPLG